MSEGDRPKPLRPTTGGVTTGPIKPIPLRRASGSLGTESKTVADVGRALDEVSEEIAKLPSSAKSPKTKLGPIGRTHAAVEELVNDLETQQPVVSSDRDSTHAPSSVPPRQSLVNVTGAGLAGALLFLLCLSPLGIGQLAFVVSFPWAWLIVDARRVTLLGYGVLYISGVLMWLGLLLVESSAGTPYFATAFTQVLALGVVLPLFVVLGRVGRRVWHLPAYLWLPLVWVSIEYVRGNLFGGFDLGLLAHAVVDSRRIIQLTDLVGSYGLSALMVACGASIAELFWLQIRLRRLERSMPRLVDPRVNEENVVPQKGIRPLIRRERDQAASSLQMALRRNRDRTRDNHLVFALFTVVMSSVTLLLAYQYGGARVDETRQWKMYEKALFEMAIVGGPETRKLLQKTPYGRDALMVAALTEDRLPQPMKKVHGTSEKSKVGTMLIVPAELSQWQVVLRGQINGKPLTESFDVPPPDWSPEISRYWASPRSGVVIPPIDGVVPIRFTCVATSTPTIEQTVRQACNQTPDHGLNIDAAIVVISPNPWDGSAWPRLLTRSVLSAAVANRTAVIAIVPESTMAVANGDGELFCSAEELMVQAPSSTAALMTSKSAQNPGELGQAVGGVIRIGAMFDPRQSLSLTTAPWFPWICLTLVFFSVVHHWVQWWRTSPRQR